VASCSAAPRTRSPSDWDAPGAAGTSPGRRGCYVENATQRHFRRQTWAAWPFQRCVGGRRRTRSAARAHAVQRANNLRQRVRPIAAQRGDQYDDLYECGLACLVQRCTPASEHSSSSSSHPRFTRHAAVASDNRLFTHSTYQCDTIAMVTGASKAVPAGLLPP
jgi:hypothetical protein